jgi:calcineurin-like phosphoesterase family protein
MLDDAVELTKDNTALNLTIAFNYGSRDEIARAARRVTEDGSVEWLQAVEFYNALRFHEKDVILLSYPGAGHGLRRYENQKDFQIRMRQFFDHHLKGEPAPRWMTEGRSYIAKEDAREAAEAKEEGGA